MGKKKNLSGLDEYEMGFIEAKMGKVKLDDDIASLSESKNSYKVDIKCKNKKQKDFLNVLKNKENQICFGMGSAGSGKSYISLAYALQALKDNENMYEKIIILIPTLQSCSTALNVGLLKGSLEDKIRPYLEADSMTMEKILKNSGNINPRVITEQLLASGRIDFKLVNFVRGITYSDCIVLINEAEGYNKDEMLLILTRIGENCKVIVTGDEAQLTRKDLRGTSGMKYAVDKLGDMDEVGITEFTNDDIVRNPLISKIIEKWK